jgi:TRAP-type mannitol/chloroaromatic compound transport system permease small subunit
MCPYSLGFSGNSFEIIGNCRIPMFGWNRRLDVVYPPSSFPEGVWTGLFAWIFFYLPYVSSCVLFYVIFYGQSRPQIEKDQKSGGIEEN